MRDKCGTVRGCGVRWDPQLYLRFDDERSRPFFDLVARLPELPARRVADLGCGPGQLTATLAQRFPEAEIVGVDASPEMVNAARAGTKAGAVRFELGDATTWQPEAPLDVLVSNAALHWIEDHVERLGQWLGLIRPGGVFAFQVPANFAAPSHRSFAEQIASPQWRDRIDPRVADRPRSFEPVAYLEALLAFGASVEVWETTYYHLLQGPDPVLTWIRATALGPVLAALAPDDVAPFEAELGERLRAAYPEGLHGTVFPFRRVFAIATRPCER